MSSSSRSQTGCERLKDDLYKCTCTGESPRQFISRRRLTDLLQPDIIHKVLRCSCDSCTQQRSASSDLTRLSRWISKSAVRTFALLAYSGCAQLISGLFEQCWTDEKIEGNLKYLTTKSIPHTFWPNFHATDPGRSSRLADQVAWFKYTFFVPTLNDRVATARDVPTFDKDAIIPVTNERPIGKRTESGHIVQQGGFGKVYTFELVDEYKDFDACNNSLELVRKEVDCSNHEELPEELHVLLHVKELDDENIVRLVTAYRHGDNINYVFPRATMNLEQYLRGPPTRSPVSSVSIERHPIWEQILALLRVLYRLQNDVYHTTSGKRIGLYHFDLKPANVLVDLSRGKPKLLVADFGLSRFRQAATRAPSTSKITAFGGTAAYAPPEMEKVGYPRNHKYDVWSLGCIMLEICAYVVEGHVGVLNLDDTRDTILPLGGRNSDDCFWHTNKSGQEEIKPTVTHWMHQLPLSSNVGSKASVEFITRVLNLAKDMLNVNVEHRLSSEAAQNRLSWILKSAERGQQNVRSCLTLPLDDVEGSALVGADELDRLALVDCKYGTQEFQKDVQLRLYEEVYKNTLHLELWRKSERVQDIKLGACNTVMLTPTPAMDPNKHNRIDIALLSHTNDHRRDMVKIWSSGLRDALLLQCVLLGQVARSFGTELPVRRSLPIKSVHVARHVAWPARITRSKGKVFKPTTDWGAPLAVQLWSEHSYRDADAWKKLRSRVSSPRHPFEVPARRIVLLCENALVLIQFGKNVRLEKPHGKYTGTCHRIIPTDARSSSRDPSFRVAELPSRGRQSYAQLPLDREELLALEENPKVAFECSCLELDFQNRQDWEDFQGKYLVIKKEWKDEDKYVDSLKKFGAEQRGWGQERVVA